MYDFLCLLPHATASHSFLHYVNLHKDLHVASFMNLGHVSSKIEAHKRNFRPYIQHLGLSSKIYHKPEGVKSILDACRRNLIIQTVRDPVSCLVSQINNTQMVAIIHQTIGFDYGLPSIDQQIVDAVTKYITHYRASMAYEADSFDQHIVVDMTDLMPNKTEATLNKLWHAICGNANHDRLISEDYHSELGSKFSRYLREYATLTYDDVGVKFGLAPRTDGDLMIERYQPATNKYLAYDTCLHTFPDINEYLPNMQATGPLHMCAVASEWNVVHPKIRPEILSRCISFFEQNMRVMNHVFGLARQAPKFTLEELTASQKDHLRNSIGDDVAEFSKRHPAAVENWAVTNEFLNS